MDRNVSPFPRVSLGDWQAWVDRNYIPTSPMRTTERAAALLPFPGSIPSMTGGPAPGQSTFIDDPWHVATIVSSVILPSALATPDAQPFLSAPNTRRNLLMFRNTSLGGQNIYLEFGKVPTADTVLFLVPNQIILFDTVVSQDDLYAACDVAGGRLGYGFSTISNP